MALVHMPPHEAPVERWSTRGTDATARLRSWSEILAATHLAFEIRSTWRTPSRFQAAVTRRAIGDLMLVDCAATPFLGHRDRAVIGGDTDAGHENVLGFQFVFKGVELVREGDRQLALKAGDMVLWDGMQPTEIEIAEAFCKRTLLFPRERVLAVCPRLGGLDALPSLQGSASARLLVRFMNALAAEKPSLDAAAGAAAANAALELLRAAVEPALPSDRAATRAAMRAEIARYVRTRLQDPQLGPASIARGVRDVGAYAARAVRGRGHLGGRDWSAVSAWPAAWRTSSSPTAARSPRSPSAGASATPPTSPGCSSVSSARHPQRSATPHWPPRSGRRD